MRTPELPLGPRPADQSLQQWLYVELRRAILEGRLPRGQRLPASRDLARQHGLSRGTVVVVYEQMQAEGYLTARVGSGTRVNTQLPEDFLETPAREVPKDVSTRVDNWVRPTSRPFHPNWPAVTQFPVETWARIASKQIRRLTPAMLAGGDPHGYLPLREALATYLGSSRGVRCRPDQIFITSGVQQGLDLLARLLTRPGDPVWIEDPGYFGAADAFRHAGAAIIGVPVDDEGLRVEEGRKLSPDAVAAYVTPGHHFGLGVTMSAPRRLELLAWAKQSKAWILEDDYDSEYRFSGRPVPALQGLDDAGRVIHLGSFNKTLFPALRLGYAVLPESLLEEFSRLRFELDRYPPSIPQTILAHLISQGHFGRHLRRMRQLYAGRLETLQECAHRFLDGVVEVAPIQAGLFTTARLLNGLTSAQAEVRAARHNVNAFGLHRFCIRRNDVEGVLLGFAGYSKDEIRQGVIGLREALGAANQPD